MSTTHTSLDAAATERKARLAQLKSLKRKAPASDDLEHPTASTSPSSTQDPSTTSPPPAPSSTTDKYLSGRNYDAFTRGPKLGFESLPDADLDTLEDRAADISLATKAAADEEEKANRPIDLFKLQPKKPNWDLKRDVARKLERLNVRTDNAIARIVRERIEGQRRKGLEERGTGGVEGKTDAGGGEGVGLGGAELLEGVRVREREEERERVEGDEEEEEEDEGGVKV